MLEPKQYTAMTLEGKADPFTGKTSRQVTGYYVRYIDATPPPISTQYERDKFIQAHTHHYIFCDGFSDWALPRPLEKHEIKFGTLKEVENPDGRGLSISTHG